MNNEVLCKFFCHNIYTIRQPNFELVIEPVFWDDEFDGKCPVVLSMVRPS